ncbi:MULTISPECIES: DUF4132 domain-containing protein [unclassified Bradyrhizobium]|uniref:DUF4132 domain-containing protein n=1 Tax=unclassified Bradyrhizobium TaxID=2631580 RepID=UPI0024E0B0CB|nr:MULTISPECIES: DUF4132 domain-containing protein [unclassified Bradyrhizobium]
MIPILSRMKALDEQIRNGVPQDNGFNPWTRLDRLGYLITELLDETLPLTESQLATLLRICGENVYKFRHKMAYDRLLRQIKPLAERTAPNSELADAIIFFATAMRAPGGAGKTFAARVEKLVPRAFEGPVLLSSDWAKQVLAQPFTNHQHQALVLAIGAAGKSKPSAKFLNTAHELMAQEAALAEQVMSWIEAYTPDPQAADPNEDTIRSLIWMMAASPQDFVAPRLGRHCELCFKKIPMVGAHSIKLGNATIQALAALGTPLAIAELTRLKSRIRYPLVVRRIAATLDELAADRQISAAELEEIALPTFDLTPAGERVMPMGDGAAILRITGSKEVTLSFRAGSGRETASPPAALKDAAPDVLATARRLRKEIEAALAGQSARIERLYLSEREIPLADWRARYLDHPLLAGMTRRLIWRFTSATGGVAGLPRGDSAIEDVEGRPLALDAGTTVSLWHPMSNKALHVLAWRRRLAACGITQPFKQAHREIYLLTEAERTTDIYSNRFAAHIIRQHQFKALCDQRGWTYQLMGAWDSHNTPTRPLPEHDLVVEFWVNGIENAEIGHTGVYDLIATDQVRFVAANGETLRLADVPPLLFSELMRDVDLFVGVCSVGNDPNWSDGGPEGAYRDYWQSYAFGDLSPSAKTRGEALAGLLPALVIADRCTLDDRFLTVRGNLRTYRIHLGSGNVQMEPNGQYLCIVPGRGKSAGPSSGALMLPFEGDATLSIILSKAFLLTRDDAITDTTITRQIAG